MKKYVVSSAVAAAFFAVCFAWTCLPSSPAVGPAAGIVAGHRPFPTGIALVDVNYILKKHVRLDGAVEKISRPRPTSCRRNSKSKCGSCNEEAKQLGPADLKPGTPDYNDLEEKLVSEKATIQTRSPISGEEFIQREAHLLLQRLSSKSVRKCGTTASSAASSIVLNFNHETHPRRQP